MFFLPWSHHEATFTKKMKTLSPLYWFKGNGQKLVLGCRVVSAESCLHR